MASAFARVSASLSSAGRESQRSHTASTHFTIGASWAANAGSAVWAERLATNGSSCEIPNGTTQPSPTDRTDTKTARLMPEHPIERPSQSHLARPAASRQANAALSAKEAAAGSAAARATRLRTAPADELPATDARRLATRRANSRRSAAEQGSLHCRHAGGWALGSQPAPPLGPDGPSRGVRKPVAVFHRGAAGGCAYHDRIVHDGVESAARRVGGSG